MTVEVYSPSVPPVDIQEVVRYAGGCDGAALDTVRECVAEAEGMFSFRAAAVCVSVNRTAEGISLDLFSTSSRDLAYTLRECRRAVIFGATVGVEIDRAVRRHAVTSPARALIMQAIGAERIEALCDALCGELEKKYGRLTPRFSPGYGDLPIEVQRDIIDRLDCPRKIGLSLGQSLLMTPTKSVTAVVGIKGNNEV